MNELTVPWVSVKERCSYMGMSIKSVCRRLETQEMPVHRIGHLLKIKISEPDNWIEAGFANLKQQQAEAE